MRTVGRRRDNAEEAVLRLLQEHAAELLRFARRFSLCADDAHDAYQRAVEILVRRMRTDPPESPLNWLRTVLKHEAVAVRLQREQLVGRDEVDLDRHEGRHLEDPAERAVGYERLRHTAEALQRLKPQEVTALVLRAEGLSYQEICARMNWTYTKTNRCVSEGRRALLDRLGAIESGAECERWLPLLSALADGEATAGDLTELRPHLRACPACRATLRGFHDAPATVAALVPAAAIPVVAGAEPSLSLFQHVEAAVHTVAERATMAAMRLQGAFDAVPGGKLAAVAASTAAVAGGGAAIEQTTHAHRHARASAVVATASNAARASTGSHLIAVRPLLWAPRDARHAHRGTAAPDVGSEFALEAAGTTARAAPTHRAAAPVAAFTASPPPVRAAKPSERSPPEFAGP
jgi:RNA polymerase sigma factor (sigma-70 family)